MSNESVKVSEIQIEKVENPEPYQSTLSKLQVKFNFSDSGDYKRHRDYVEEILTKAIPHSRISSSCEYGGHHLRQDVDGSSINKRTRFSITDTSPTPRQILIRCYEIKPDLASEYLRRVISLIRKDFETSGVQVKGEDLLNGKN